MTSGIFSFWMDGSLLLFPSKFVMKSNGLLLLDSTSDMCSEDDVGRVFD